MENSVSTEIQTKAPSPVVVLLGVFVYSAVVCGAFWLIVLR
jgi:hypothetical protein